MFVCQLNKAFRDLIRDSARDYFSSEFPHDSRLPEMIQNVMEEKLCNVTELLDSEKLAVSLYELVSDMDYLDYIDSKEEDIAYLKNEIDTKGFYQPVYYFEVVSLDGAYKNQIMIPAFK